MGQLLQFSFCMLLGFGIFFYLTVIEGLRELPTDFWRWPWWFKMFAAFMTLVMIMSVLYGDADADS